MQIKLVEIAEKYHKTRSCYQHFSVKLTSLLKKLLKKSWFHEIFRAWSLYCELGTFYFTIFPSNQIQTVLVFNFTKLSVKWNANHSKIWAFWRKTAVFSHPSRIDGYFGKYPGYPLFWISVLETQRLIKPKCVWEQKNAITLSEIEISYHCLSKTFWLYQ